MSNKTNSKKLVKQILLEEEKFLSDVFSKMPFQKTGQREEEDDEAEESEMQQPKEENAFPPADKKAKRAQSFKELEARLEELKSKDRLDHRQRNLKKGLKNRIKKKSKKEERLMQKKLVRTGQIAAGTSKVKEENGEAPKVVKVPKPKPVFNSQGHMVFSKFDFSQVGTKRKSKTEKDPKKILKQMEHKKQKVQELVESGDKEKAEEIKQKEAWKSVLAKASGEKVRDDPELLKKSIKRVEQQKKQGSKKWESRIEGVQKTIQEKQQKRQENIMKRKKEKKTNKLKKAAKKGRIIPGF